MGDHFEIGALIWHHVDRRAGFFFIVGRDTERERKKGFDTHIDLGLFFRGSGSTDRSHLHCIALHCTA